MKITPVTQSQTRQTDVDKVMDFLQVHSGMLITAKMSVAQGICATPLIFKQCINSIAEALSSDQRKWLHSNDRGCYTWKGPRVIITGGNK